ncbi:hypothetical protein BN940_15041 [Castellaniella defragrans 65Phen]|uniref:Uncharacterized protein n=1 Tax=Castellaniella defragrans (strain DSM 12143 / CCUG 39792 / 65Phen) TaxID=1437824 RepID=W8X5A4_CASD6|nr:hypothetical protein BN940_15041 [Castellaniella defragrans 65Phen]
MIPERFLIDSPLISDRSPLASRWIPARSPIDAQLIPH